jgi:hypothetical protein
MSVRAALFPVNIVLMGYTLTYICPPEKVGLYLDLLIVALSKLC